MNYMILSRPLATRRPVVCFRPRLFVSITFCVETSQYNHISREPKNVYVQVACVALLRICDWYVCIFLFQFNLAKFYEVCIILRCNRGWAVFPRSSFLPNSKFSDYRHTTQNLGQIGRGPSDRGWLEVYDFPVDLCVWTRRYAREGAPLQPQEIVIAGILTAFAAHPHLIPPQLTSHGDSGPDTYSTTPATPDPSFRPYKNFCGRYFLLANC